MDLYLIRHAEALAIGERGITNDEERPLSEHGEGEAQAAAKAMTARGIELDRLYTSPLVRARQTAEIMLKTWARPELILETCDDLAPNGKARKLSKYLLKQGGDKIGLIGHNPDLSEFVGWLLGDKKIQLELAKAGIAHVICGDLPGKGQGALQWLVTPDWY